MLSTEYDILSSFTGESVTSTSDTVPQKKKNPGREEGDGTCLIIRILSILNMSELELRLLVNHLI